MNFSRQFDQMDCGPACVRMVASCFGRNYPLSYLRSLAHLTREGVSVAGIRDSLLAIGIESGTFEMTLEQLHRDCPLPAILYWNQNHFVVLEKVKGNTAENTRYKIADPAFGQHWISADELCRHWLNGNKGVVIAMEPTDDFYKKESIKEHHNLADFVHKYILPYKAQLTQSMLALLVGTMLGLVSPFLTQSVVDDGIGLHDTSLITTILIAQLALFFGSFLISTIGAWVGLYMSTHITIGILGDYLRKLLKLPMSFFETKSIGDYQQRLSDHSRLQSFMTISTLETLFSLLSIPFYMAIIIFYSPLVLAVFLGFTIAGTLWTTYFFRKRKALDYEQFRVSVENQNKLYEMMSGIIDIKVNAYDSYKLAEWERLQMRQYAMSQKSLKLGQIQETGSTIISQLRNIVITYWIATLVVNGTLTLGMMMSISTIIGMISGPLGQLTGFLQQYQDAKISLERSQEVHLCDNEDASNAQDISSNEPLDIVLKDVSFSYTGHTGQEVLHDISFKIPAGKMTAIVGESGSGKTTLMKLLLKFYQPTTGNIFFGSKNINTYSARSIRKETGIVMQESFLFSDTIRQNIVMGEDFDEQRLQEAIRIACLSDLFQNHPMKENTKIGSEGIGLSGGEKQRIMIARAAYKRPVYLMMDEATSSLDADNEACITKNLDEHFAKSTRIVIAHRLSTVKNADNIVVLRHGRIVEQGTHAELVKQGGYYFKLVQNQIELPSV